MNNVKQNSKQYLPRIARTRLLFNGKIHPVSLEEWTRTISYSDIRRYLECPAAYLMASEGDKPDKAPVTQRIGDFVHRESALAPEQRKDATSIAKALSDLPAEVRESVVKEVKAMMEVIVAHEETESKDAEVTRRDDLIMIWHDTYTNTYWYAKPDNMDILDDGRGKYLNVVDKKTGKGRRSSHHTGVFFFGYVAKMTEVFGHRGPVRTIVRYLKDRAGKVLAQPEDKTSWIGRNLTSQQERTLQGLQATVKQISNDWAKGEFETRPCNACEYCQFASNCLANRARKTQVQQVTTQELEAA
jgi:hypothetical protein